MELPVDFLNRMKLQLQDDFENYLEAMNKKPARGLRINTLKISVDDFLNISPWKLEKTGIIDDGYILVEENDSIGGIGNHPYHLAGLFYMQEPSAMSAVAALNIEPGMKILDLCAAPGGKSGAIASRLRGKGLLVSNEIVPNRAKTLSFTLERLGVTNAVVTCARPDVLADKFENYFDAVLVDAPCSGEGMFRKDNDAIVEWSLEHTYSCASRQSAILESAKKMLKPGGTLVYSTCTFSQVENESVIDKFIDENPEYSLDYYKRLYPHTSCGEGHFVARLTKAENDIVHNSVIEKFDLKECKDKSYLEFLDRTFDILPSGKSVLLNDGRIIIIPNDMISIPKGIKIISMGVLAGNIIKGRFEPEHSLFMAANGARYKNMLSYNYKDKKLMQFLVGNAIEEDYPKGFLPVCVDGFPIGFGKSVDGLIKNHIPKGIRLLKV